MWKLDDGIDQKRNIFLHVALAHIRYSTTPITIFFTRVYRPTVTHIYVTISYDWMFRVLIKSQQWEHQDKRTQWRMKKRTIKGLLNEKPLKDHLAILLQVWLYQRLIIDSNFSRVQLIMLQLQRIYLNSYNIVSKNSRNLKTRKVCFALIHIYFTIF